MWSQYQNRDENERILSKLPRRYLQQQQRIQAEQSYDHLLVFGYQCKLYRDDDKARSVNSGQQLIPWMGDESLMIDRYDARGHLHDLSQFDPKNYRKQKLSGEEAKFEEELNEIRYADLKYEDRDSVDSQRQQEELQEKNEELNEEQTKRQQGSCIPYNYNDNNNDSNSNPCPDSGENNATDDIFVMPNCDDIPDGLILPESFKLAAVIEKTAQFVAKQNAQMEILLKAKQSSNPSFDFLSVDSELYPFYKFVLKQIKTNKWPGIAADKKNASAKSTKDDDCLKNKKNTASSSPESDENSDSDSEHYLHPSLLSTTPRRAARTLSSSSSKATIIPKIHDPKDSKYSRVIKELRSKYSFSSNDDDDDDDDNNKLKKPNNNCDNEESDESSKDSFLGVNIPDDTKKIIEKLAESVAKNGDKFENSIRALNDNKFAFLITSHEYHHYYIERKIHHFKLEKLKELKKNITKTTNKTAFSINAKNEPRMLDHSASALLDEEQLKEKTIQNLRKQKAAEFLKSLKNKSSGAENSFIVPVPQEPKVFGPELPEPNLDKVPSDDDDDELIEEWIENLDNPVNFEEKEKFKNNNNDVLNKESENEKRCDDVQPMFIKKNRTGTRRERKRLKSRSRSKSPSSKKLKFIHEVSCEESTSSKKLMFISELSGEESTSSKKLKFDHVVSDEKRRDHNNKRNDAEDHGRKEKDKKKEKKEYREEIKEDKKNEIKSKVEGEKEKAKDNEKKENFSPKKKKEDKKIEKKDRLLERKEKPESMKDNRKDDKKDHHKHRNNDKKRNDDNNRGDKNSRKNNKESREHRKDDNKDSKDDDKKSRKRSHRSRSHSKSRSRRRSRSRSKSADGDKIVNKKSSSSSNADRHQTHHKSSSHKASSSSHRSSSSRHKSSSKSSSKHRQDHHERRHRHRSRSGSRSSDYSDRSRSRSRHRH